MSHTLHGLSTASILCDSAPLLCPERALLEAVTAPPPDARSSRATYTQWKCPDGSAAAGGCDSSEMSGRPESNEYPTRRAQEYAAPPRPKYAARKKTKWPWVIASSVAAHKLPLPELVRTPLAVAGREMGAAAPHRRRPSRCLGGKGGEVQPTRAASTDRGWQRGASATRRPRDATSNAAAARRDSAVGRPACCVPPSELLAGARNAAHPRWRVRWQRKASRPHHSEHQQ